MWTAKNANEFQATVDDYLGDPEERRSVVRASVDATTAVGPFKNEYVFFFDFDESGEKITKITEFVDSVASMDIQRRFKEAGHT